MRQAVIHFFSFLLLVSIMVSCQGETKTEPDATTETETPENTPETPADSIVAEPTGVAVDDSTNVPDTDTPGDDVVAPLEDRPTNPVTSTNNNSGISGLAARVVSDNRMATALETIARNIEALELAYLSSEGQDCSGIYHKVKDRVQQRVPPLADENAYVYPTFRDDRNSRQIAHWYHQNGNLHIVQNGLTDRNKIRPGSVMFYGRTDEKYSNLNIDLLTNPGVFVHDGTKGKIMHIAVVTSVEKDDAGNVVKYTIVHGRNKKHFASRSGGNWESRPGSGTAKQHKKFPFGNWNQQWVAVAHIETPIN